MPRDENGNLKTVYTTKEAAELGFKSKDPPPEPKTCKYCGKTLYYEGIYYYGMIWMWKDMPQRCDCAKANQYWAKKDAEHEAAKKQEAEDEARKRRAERIGSLMGNSGIKRRFVNRTFDNFKTDTPGRENAYRIAKSYADNFLDYYRSGSGLYIEGTNGTGKTHIAAAIALQLIGQEIPVICKTSIDLFADLKSAYDGSTDVTEHQITEAYRTVDLLIVDDLGKEQCTEWSMSALYSILNDRYEDMKPTIVTTNYGMDDLITALTPSGGDRTKIAAVISRLREVSTIITMNWKDYRQG